MIFGGDGIKKLTGLFDKYKYLLLVIAAGIVLLLIPAGSAGKTAAKAQKEEEFSIEDQEKKLGVLIASIQGAGRVRVMLTLRSGIETVYQNEEQNSVNRSDRSDTSEYSYEQSEEKKPIVLSDGSGGEQPVIRQKLYPEYQGALIVCDGADSSYVRLKITEAVASLLNIGADRITVAKMKN